MKARAACQDGAAARTVWMKEWAVCRDGAAARAVWMKVWAVCRASAAVRMSRMAAGHRPEPRDMDVPGQKEAGEQRRSAPGREDRPRQGKRAGDGNQG